MDLYNKKPSKNNKVPTKFKAILTDLIKEILINKPNDIIEFCANYFKIKQEEFQINLNRSTTFPVAPPNNNGFKKSLSINKKKIVTKKAHVKKIGTKQKMIIIITRQIIIIQSKKKKNVVYLNA